MTRFLKLSGAESLSVAGNIFLGQTEAPLLIKGYLNKMNRSEMLLVMTGGMATLAGGVLAAYIAFLGGDDINERLKSTDPAKIKNFNFTLLLILAAAIILQSKNCF